MLKSPLGKNGPMIPRIGYGAMVMEGYYGEADDTQVLNTLNHAMDRGLMIDTADAYGEGHNASPEYAHKALSDSLLRLNVETIDLWYMHYPDPDIAIEESVDAMAEAVKAGKVRYLGLSNVTSEQVRKAHAVHPISTVQYEYSLWRREAETDLIPTLREFGIALVGWSPLGSGLLAGGIDTLKATDFRTANPKLSGDNFDENKKRMEKITELAQTLQLSPAQLSLTWLLAQGEDIFPIPGTRKASRIDENLLAASVVLSQEAIEEISNLTRSGTFLGGARLD